MQALSKSTLSHQQLTDRAVAWLRNNQRCSVVLENMYSRCMERPDAIGWRSRHSTVIECKTSSADFRGDIRKTIRIHSFMGMGLSRFYLAEPNILRVERLPKGWGLLETDGRSVTIVKNSDLFERSETDEIQYLVSALRREQESRPPTHAELRQVADKLDRFAEAL